MLFIVTVIELLSLYLILIVIVVIIGMFLLLLLSILHDDLFAFGDCVFFL